MKSERRKARWPRKAERQAARREGPAGPRARHRDSPPVTWVAYRSEEGFLADFEQCLHRGGIFVNARRSLPVGARIRLGLRLPTSAAPLFVEGRVAWISLWDNEQNEPPGYFVRLERLDRNIWDRLRNAALRAGAGVRRRRAVQRPDQSGACEPARRAVPRSLPAGLALAPKEASDSSHA